MISGGVGRDYGPSRAADPSGPRRSDPPLTVAYVMSRFPKLSETFILREILALQKLGIRVELYPLLRGRESVVHTEAEPLVERARYLPFLSASILWSQFWFLRHRPRAYLAALRAVLCGTWGSLNFFVGALGIFPKAVHAARLMDESGVQHVHCHFATHPAVAGLVVHRLSGIPFSFTVHGSDLHVDRHMLCQKVLEAAFVVPISRFNRDVIVAECGEEVSDRLVVVHCGVDTAALSPGPCRPPEVGTFEVVCVGTLHEVKGQSYLIEACRLLVDEDIDVRCRLIGTGPDEPQLRRQVAAAGLEAHVVFSGPLTQAQVATILQRADVLAAPSVSTKQGKREGIPTVLMEAMSSGVPVVASRLSGIPELVEDGCSGLLVPPGDARVLAAALRRLHHDRELGARLAGAGRETVVRDFDVHASASLLSSLFLGRAEARLA